MVQCHALQSSYINIKLISLLIVMPIITVALYTDRTQGEKDRLAETIIEDVVKILKVKKRMLH